MIKNLRPRVPEIAKLKIGRKSDETYTARNSNRVYRRPQKLDYFLVTKTSRYDDDDDENFEIDEGAMRALEPWADKDRRVRQIPVRVGSDVIEEVLFTEYAAYTGKVKVCWGDGGGEKSARRRLPVLKDGRAVGYSRETTLVDCPCERLADGRCKPKGRLNLKLDVPGYGLSGGFMVHRTTSIISIEQLVGSMQDILHDIGGMHGYRLWAVVRPVRCEPDGKPTTVYCTHLEQRESDIRKLQHFVIEGQVIREKIAGRVDYRALMASTTLETEAEQAEVNEEFFPDTIDEEPHDIGTGEVPARAAPAERKAEAGTTESKPTPQQPRGRKSGKATTEDASAPAPVPAPAPAAAPEAPGVELDESTRRLYALQDEQARKAEEARRNAERSNAPPSSGAGEAGPSATWTNESGDREPGDDDEDAVGRSLTTTEVPEDDGHGQRSLLGEEPKPAEAPRQGNAALRNRLSGGKNGGNGK